MEQQIVDPVHGARAIPLVQLLQLRLDRRERVGVEQFAQFRFAQQLTKLRLVDRQRLRPALGQRRIAVVEVVGDVAKQQR